MIEINNLTSVFINKEFLKKIVKKILKEENKKETKLSINLVTPEIIKKLNKKYRRKNKTTDVLAFPGGVSKKEKFIFPPGFKKELGEIVICLHEVKKNAKRYGFSFKKELVRVLIHGLLHLLGYDHEVHAKKTKKMEERQEYYLSQIMFS